MMKANFHGVRWDYSVGGGKLQILIRKIFFRLIFRMGLTVTLFQYSPEPFRCSVVVLKGIQADHFFYNHALPTAT